MNKYGLVMIMGLLTALPTMAEEPGTTTTPCANGGGVVVIANNKAKYCLSNKGMNWFSAHAWCDAMNGTLIELGADCGGVSTCPNLAGIVQEETWVSTQNPKSASDVYRVNIYNGTLNVDNKARPSARSGFTLCRMN